MDHEEEDEMCDAKQPGVYNYTTLVSTAPDKSREIGLNAAVSLSLHEQISADSVLDFAEQFRNFLDPVSNDAPGQDAKTPHRD